MGNKKQKQTNKQYSKTNKQTNKQINKQTENIPRWMILHRKIVLLLIYHNGNSCFMYKVMKVGQKRGSKIGSEEIVKVETLITFLAFFGFAFCFCFLFFFVFFCFVLFFFFTFLKTFFKIIIYCNSYSFQSLKKKILEKKKLSVFVKSSYSVSHYCSLLLFHNCCYICICI